MGMGPASVWHYIDSTYATSAALAHLRQTSIHAIAARKADFLATLQATLTRANFRMLMEHTGAKRAAAAPPPAEPPANRQRTTPPETGTTADDSPPTTPEHEPD